MNSFLTAIALFFRHLFTNISNYCLVIGIGCILHFVYDKFGTDTLILSIGALLVLISIVIEVNKPKKR